MHVADKTAFLLAVCLAMPAAGAAQTIAVTSPSDTTPPVPLASDNAPVLNGGGTGLSGNPNWWQPPVSHTTLPQWAIGHTFAFTTAGGLTLSAGFFGRQGDPLPLYMSEGAGRQASDDSIPGPGSYLRQWDTKLGVSMPVWSNGHVKIRALGELFVPLAGSGDAANPPGSFLNARTLRFGIVTTF